jgi:hypothetical protein
MAEEERDDVLPESKLEVVVRSPEIQDAEPIHSHRCLGLPRVVVVGLNSWQTTSSTRRQ